MHFDFDLDLDFDFEFALGSKVGGMNCFSIFSLRKFDLLNTYNPALRVLPGGNQVDGLPPVAVDY